MTDEVLNRLTSTLIRQGVPARLHQGILLWTAAGLRPGSFLCAVLANDLRGAFACADRDSRDGMFQLVCALHSALPLGAWGSGTAMDDWSGHGGLHGLMAAA